MAGIDNVLADAISRDNTLCFTHRFLRYKFHEQRVGVVGGSQARLGLTQMDRLVQGLLDQGISKSTWAVYQSGWQKYARFCQERHYSMLPLVEHNSCQFAAVMSQTV